MTNNGLGVKSLQYGPRSGYVGLNLYKGNCVHLLETALLAQKACALLDYGT